MALKVRTATSDYTVEVGRRLWSADMCRTADQEPVWWQEFCWCWSGTVYQLHCVTLTAYTAKQLKTYLFTGGCRA